MKSSWCDTDGRREGNGAGRCMLRMKRAQCLDKAGGRNRTGYGVTQERERAEKKREKLWMGGWEEGEKEGGRVFNS